MRNQFARAGSLSLIFFAIIILVLGSGLVKFPNLAQPFVIAEATPSSRSEISIRSQAFEPVVQVGADSNLAPYAYVVDGQPAGFDIDLIRSVADTMGFSIDIHMAPMSTLHQQLSDGELDMVVGVASIPEHDEAFDYSTPYAAVSMDLFARDDSKLTSFEDAQKKDVIVPDGSFMHDFLRDSSFSGRIITVKDTADALRLLSSGQFDAALLPKIQGQFEMNRFHLTNLHQVGVDLEPFPYGFAVQKGNQDLLLKLNEGLSILNSTGQYDRIYQTWFGVYERRQTSGLVRSFIIALLAAGTLLAGALVWSWMLRRQVLNRTGELRKSEQEYRRLVENASEGVGVVCENKLVFLNPRMIEMSGYSREELERMRIIDIVLPEDRHTAMENHNDDTRLETVNEQYSVRVVTKKGEVKWILINSVRIDWEGKPAWLDLFSDITEIKQAETRIKQQLDQMAALRAVEVAIARSTDLNLVLRLLLEQVTSQLGVDAADVLLLNRKSHILKFAAEHGFRTSSIRAAVLSMEEGYAGRAALQRHPVFIQTLRGAPRDMLSAPNLSVESFYAYYCTPLIAKGEVLGVLEVYQRGPMPPGQEWMDLIETMAHQAAIAIDNAAMFDSLEQANRELTQAYERTIEGWARALEMRDGDTEGHSQRVTDLTVELAERMCLSAEEIAHIRRGALLHDIGKIGIPDSILRKNGPLTPYEWSIMRQHPAQGYEMISQIEFLAPATDIPYNHHERWDGTGYPRGLKGTDIPMAARIFSVVDVWDALRVDRSYRGAWAEEKIWNFILAGSGRQFDPVVVDAFLQMMKPELLEEHRRFREPLAAD